MSTLALTDETETSIMTKVRSNLKRMLPAVHTQFWYSASFSLMAPFYPNLARSKNVPSTQYGFVFSVFKFAMFVGSITSEMVMHRVSPEAVYLSGIIGQFVFGLALGALYWCPPGPWFLVLSMIFAVIGGHMGTWYSVSMYGIVTDEFSGKTGIIISSMELFWGLGNMFGSSIGGILIDLWAFPLPYIVLGTIMMLAVPVIIAKGPVGSKQDRRLTPPEDVYDDALAVQQEANVNYKKLWLLPMFSISMMTIVFSWVVMGFNEPTLEPYIQETFNMTNTEVGLVFMVQFGSYATGAVISGIMWHFQQDVLFLFIAQAFTAIAFLIQGPSPILKLKPSVTLVVISQVFTGIGMAGQFVCGFANALHTAVRAGYPDNLKTTGVVSSWTFTCLVLGAIVTPPAAAKVVDVYGYRNGTLFIMVPLALWSLVNAGMWIYTLFVGYDPHPARTTTVNVPNPINADVRETTSINDSEKRA